MIDSQSFKKNTEIIISFLFILMPFLIISGPFLTDLLISIMALYVMFFVKDKKFYKNNFFYFFLTFFFIIVVSSVFSDNKIFSLKSSFFYFRFGFYIICVWYLIEKNFKIIKNLHKTIFLSFIILSFDTFFQFYFGYNIFGFPAIEEDRMSSFFGDELKLGSYLMRLFPILLAFEFYINKKKNDNYLVKILLIFIIQISIFLSGERTSFYLFNFTILILLIFLNDFKKEKIIVFLIYILLSLPLILTDNLFKKRIVDKTLQETSLLDTDKKKYIFSQQYHEHYLSSWMMFKDNKLLGIGPKNFRVICKEKKYNLSELTCSTHPHNFYLQLLSETGIVGFFIPFTLTIFLWYLLLKNLYSKLIYKIYIYSNFQICLIISVIITVWPIAPSGNIFNNWMSAIYYLPGGFLLWSFNQKKKKT